MRKLGATINYNKKWIIGAVLYAILFNVIWMTITDLYLTFGFILSVDAAFFFISVLILRFVCLTAYANFFFIVYHIYVRYRLLNEHLR